MQSTVLCYGQISLPKIATTTMQTVMAIIPPLDMVKDPESGPAAPAALSTAPEDAASPAEGPLPGWIGAVVASAEKKDATELEDILAVRDT